MVPVQKSNGKLRICVDLRKLNGAVQRARFLLPTLEDIAPKLAGIQYFSKLDASSGFWQIPLHPDSAKLTTFITPFGRFCFKRLPFGITCAPEIFQFLMTDLLKSEEGCKAIMDDIVVFGKSAEEHDENLQKKFQVIKDSLSTTMQRAPKRRFRGPRNPKVLRRQLKAVEICLHPSHPSVEWIEIFL